MKSIITFFTVTLILISFSISAQVLKVATVNSESFNYVYAEQENTNWCWAASIQMIFNYYGVDISQEQIVKRSYGSDPNGKLPNWAGSLEIITANLNNWNMDNQGRVYVVQSTLYYGAPTPYYLVQELTAGRPMLIGYMSGPTSGHAVVLTAVTYYETMNGPYIQSIVVRDPWPNKENKRNKGRVEYPALNLAQVINAHWYIRIM